MTDDQFRALCNVYGFAPSRALRELIDCAVGQAALAEPVQEPCQCGDRPAEPVAWSHINGTSDTKWHPPKRKPLTDEEIRDLWSWAMTAEAERTATTQQHAFARAVERAHGIGGAPEERNFCPRCGKRTNDIHTCTPP